jgi:hypothetical protein
LEFDNFPLHHPGGKSSLRAPFMRGPIFKGVYNNAFLALDRKESMRCISAYWQR